jgi:hypothetical protein
MGLITSRTNLKSVGYGKDSRGGGSSGLPYVINPIPEGSLNNVLKYGTGGPDFLLKGGSLAPRIMFEELTRYSKFFASTKGILFTIKQNLLSRIAVKSEAAIGPSYGGFNEGVYSPLNSLAQISSALGIRLNKNGLDPTGLSPISLNRYFDIVKNNNSNDNNRLVKLYKQHMLVKTNDNTLFSYSGGPNSTLGIGSTTIKRYEATGINNTLYNLNKNYITYGGVGTSLTDRKDITINGNKLLGASDDAFVRDFVKTPIDNGFSFPDGNQTKYYGPQDDNSTLSTNDKGLDLVFYQAIQKSIRNKDGEYNLGSTARVYNHPWGVEDFGNLDIINFYFTIIDNDNVENNKVLYFPSFIENMADNFSSQWKTEKMMGRGEDFMIYDGFSREIPLSFKVYARDEQYLTKMYDNLNILAASLAPSYSAAGFMRGNIIKLTLGKYVEDLPGIITSLNFSVPQEGAWDVRKGVQLSQLIDVNLTFKPIHNFLPSSTQKFFAKNIALE